MVVFCSYVKFPEGSLINDVSTHILVWFDIPMLSSGSSFWIHPPDDVAVALCQVRHKDTHTHTMKVTVKKFAK